MVFSVLPLSLFMFKLVKLVHLYTHRVGMNVRQTAAAAISGLALAHTIGLAVLKGLITRNEPFFRTPKQAAPHRLFVGAGRRARGDPADAGAVGLRDRHPHDSEAKWRARSDGVAGGAADPVDSVRGRAAGIAGERVQSAGIAARRAKAGPMVTAACGTK